MNAGIADALNLSWLLAAQVQGWADATMLDAYEAERRRIGDEAYRLNVQQFCCAGLNFGYYYQGSPIIAPDDEAPPPYTMGGFTPSTVPGCRAPHFRLADGRSLYDAFGPGYTLLVTRHGVATGTLADAAARAGVPLQVLDIAAESNRPDTYAHALLLCRSDQHVAWRGQAEPADADALVAMLRGARVQDSQAAPKRATQAQAV